MKAFSKLLLVSFCFSLVMFPISAGGCSTPSSSIEALITSPQATSLGLPPFWKIPCTGGLDNLDLAEDL